MTVQEKGQEQDKRRQLRLQRVGFIAEQIGLQQKLTELDIQRDETRKRIDSLRRIIAEMNAMCGDTNIETLANLGFTDAVRAVLAKAAPDYISANDISERLRTGGFDLSQYQNPAASIYTILTRLMTSEFAEQMRDGFNTFYRMKPRKRVMRRRRFGSPPVTQKT